MIKLLKKLKSFKFNYKIITIIQLASFINFKSALGGNKYKSELFIVLEINNMKLMMLKSNIKQSSFLKSSNKSIYS